MTTATPRWVMLFALAFASAGASAQALGDEFIFFVNGTNVMVPSGDGLTVVNDPLAPASGNRVARFDYGNWTHGGFAWDRTMGVDATSLVGATYGESDTLYLSLLSDVANAGQPAVSIMLSDKTDDSPAGDGTADNEFRLLWTIPDNLHDGMWHDLAIPLPPMTYDALETARTNGELDALAENWTYPGAWSAGGFGIGPGFGGDTNDPLWREFEWDALYRIGPFWDNNTGGGSIYLDNVYIGGPDTDISVAEDPPAAMSGVSFSADGNENVVTWTDTGEFGGFNIYASLVPISDVDADGVIKLRTVGFGGTSELRHRYEIPHPSMGATPVYYAVTSLSEFGVENPDASASSGSVSNQNLDQKAFIGQLTGTEADCLFDAVSGGTTGESCFAGDHPVFNLDSSHRSPGDGTSPGTLPEDSDLSGRFLIGYSDFNELFVFGSITDDQVTLAGDAALGGDTWMFDSAEIVFGHYDVRETAGGGILVGSPHTDMTRGDEPDYGIRVAGHQDDTGAFTRVSTWVGWSLDQDFTNASAFALTTEGYEFLMLLPLDQIQNTDEGDLFMPVPETDELQFIPLILSLNDADGATRESQIVWSIKPNVTGQWWNTPAMWETVAMAGTDAVFVRAEDGTPREGFSLSQSVPNPAVGQTQIAFSLGAPSQVRVEVFNTLGQRVALVADAALAAGDQSVMIDTGALAAGVYVYRLTAGDYVAARRMTVVR